MQLRYRMRLHVMWLLLLLLQHMESAEANSRPVECSQCTAGSFLGAQCTSTEDRICTRCPPGKYSNTSGLAHTGIRESVSVSVRVIPSVSLVQEVSSGTWPKLHSIHTYSYIHIHMHIHTYAHTHTHTHTCMYVCMCVTHTHTMNAHTHVMTDPIEVLSCNMAKAYVTQCRYVNVNTCMYMYIYIYMHAHTHTHTYTHTCINIYVHIRVCEYTCVCVYTYIS
jgi:hypothetical protein